MLAVIEGLGMRQYSLYDSAEHQWSFCGDKPVATVAAQSLLYNFHDPLHLQVNSNTWPFLFFQIHSLW